MSRLTLLVISAVFVLIGIFKFIPALATMVDASWFATLVIIIGVVSFAIGYNDKK